MGQTTRQISIPELAVKLIGLILIAISLPRLAFLVFSLIATLQSALPDTSYDAGIQQGIPAICDLVAGVILLFAGRAISSKFIVKEQGEVTAVTAEALESTVYAAVGVFIVMWAIPGLVTNLADRIYLRSIGGDPSGDLYRNCMLIGHSVQLLCGIALFFGARGLAGIRSRFRQFGMKNGP